jgi:hypothetical protein
MSRLLPFKRMIRPIPMPTYSNALTCLDTTVSIHADAPHHLDVITCPQTTAPI